MVAVVLPDGGWVARGEAIDDDPAPVAPKVATHAEFAWVTMAAGAIPQAWKSL